MGPSNKGVIVLRNSSVRWLGGTKAKEAIAKALATFPQADRDAKFSAESSTIETIAVDFQRA